MLSQTWEKAPSILTCAERAMEQERETPKAP